MAGEANEYRKQLGASTSRRSSVSADSAGAYRKSLTRRLKAPEAPEDARGAPIGPSKGQVAGPEAQGSNSNAQGYFSKGDVSVGPLGIPFSKQAVKDILSGELASLASFALGGAGVAQLPAKAGKLTSLAHTSIGAGAGIVGGITHRALQGDTTPYDPKLDVGLGALGGFLAGGVRQARKMAPLTDDHLKSLEEITEWLPSETTSQLQKIGNIVRRASARAYRKELLRSQTYKTTGGKKIALRFDPKGDPEVLSTTQLLRKTFDAIESSGQMGPDFRAGVEMKNFMRQARLRALRQTGMTGDQRLGGKPKMPFLNKDERKFIEDNLPVLRDGLARLDTGHRTDRGLRETIRRFNSMFIRDELEVLTRDKAFGAAGPRMAQMAKTMTEIQDHLTALYFKHIDTIFEGYNRREREWVGRVLDGITLDPNIKGYDRIMNAVRKTREVYQSYAESAQELGIPTYDALAKEVRPFMPKGAYFPLYYDLKEVKHFLNTPSRELDALLNRVAQSLEIKGPDKMERAAVQLRRILMHGDDVGFAMDLRHRSLNFGRSLNLPVKREWDARAITKRYVLGASNRLAAARVFGPHDELFRMMVRPLARSGGDVRRFTNIYNNINNRRLDDYSAATRWFRRFVTYTGFTLRTGLLQTSQAIPTMAVHGVRRTAKALAAAMDNDIRTSVRRSAALLPSSALSETDLNSLTMRAFMKATLIEPVDRGIRGVAGIAGLIHAGDLAAEYARTTSRPPAAELARRLKNLGIDVADLASDGTLSEGQAAQAIYYGANRPNFASRAIDLPEQAHQKPFLYTLRRFGIQAWNAAKRDILRPAQLWVQTGGRAGEIAPLVRMGVAAPIIAPLIRYAQDLVANKKPDIKDVATVRMIVGPDHLPAAMEAIDIAVTIGTLGVVGDVLNTLNWRSTEALGGAVAGPALGVPADVAIAAYQVGAGSLQEKEKMKKAGLKRLVRKIPLVGQPLSNEIFPPKKQK